MTRQLATQSTMCREQSNDETTRHAEYNVPRTVKTQIYFERNQDFDEQGKSGPNMMN